MDFEIGISHGGLPHSVSSDILSRQCSVLRNRSCCGNGIRISSIVSDGKYFAPIENAEALAETCLCLSQASVIPSSLAKEKRRKDGPVPSHHSKNVTLIDSFSPSVA